MHDEIIKKVDYNLVLNQKNHFLPLKIRNSNLKGKEYPYEGIL
jgi:hypothetical protein